MKIVLTRNVLSGALFIAIGAFTAGVGQTYRMGVIANMGPGFFPVMLGLIIALIGCAILMKAVLSQDDSGVVGTWEIKPLLFVLASVLLFAALIETLGAVVALAALIACAWLASSERRLRELPLMILGLAGLALGIFVYGLGVPLKVMPW